MYHSLGRGRGRAASSGIVPNVENVAPIIRARGEVMNTIAQVDLVRFRKSPPMDVVDALRNLRRGYALVSTPNVAGDEVIQEGESAIHLAGYTVREIATLAAQAGVPLEQLFISADVIDFESVTRRAGGDVDNLSSAFTLGGRQIVTRLRRVVQIPLSEVVTPASLQDLPFTNSLGYNLQQIDELTREAEVGGSGVPFLSTFVLWENIRIVRRYPFPRNMRGLYSFRTGGFDRLILKDSTFDIYVNYSKYRLYVPGSAERFNHGMSNCVFQCILWSLYKDAVDATLACMMGGDVISHLENKCLFEAIRNEVCHLFVRFQRDWFAEKAKAKEGEPRNITINREKKVIRDWNNLVRHGFSKVLLKRLAVFLALNDISFDIYLLNDTGDQFINVAEPRGPRSFGNAGRIRNVCCFQVNIDGDIQRIPKQETSLMVSSDSGTGSNGMNAYYGKDIFPGLLHAIAVYPPLSTPFLRDCGEQLRQSLREPLKENLERSFFENREKNFGLAACLSRFQDVVQTQATRMIRDRKFGFTPSESSERRFDPLIAGSEIVSSSSSSSSPPRFTPPTKIGVCVYDIETVENIRGCQHAVHDAFRMMAPAPIDGSIMNFNPNSYHVPQSQIPYSVQWGFVNMNYKSSEEMSISNSILIGNHVHLQFGASGLNYLGECVQDFIDSLAFNASMLHYDKVFAYAHNGCAFDVILILRHITDSLNTTVKNILITPRGILSLTVNVEVAERKKVSIVFRDTKVFFADRLSDLCTTFKVPSQFCKTDFPITRVHAKNYDDPNVRAAYREYLENDVWCLAFIVYGINNIIDELVPKVPNSIPITRFVTLMSMVTHLQKNLFISHKLPSPAVCDIPALRNYIHYANMGGRVLPFWRFFKSGRTIWLLESMIRELNSPNDTVVRDRECASRAYLYNDIKNRGDFARVLDVTSLYPYAQSTYPMPTGLISWLEEPRRYFQDTVCMVLSCSYCFLAKQLCVHHQPTGHTPLRTELSAGFTFFVVKNLIPHPFKFDETVPSNVRDLIEKNYNICARKSANSGTLIYNLLPTEQINLMPKENPLYPHSLPADFLCFTMYDLFWLYKFGWTFDIVAGFSFEHGYMFRKHIQDMFNLRIKDKQQEAQLQLPKSKSVMRKNTINGTYGINAKKEIKKQYIVVADGETEGSLRSKCKVMPDENIIYDSSSHQLPNGQWILKLEKHEDSAEYFAEQSPNQIGAAVTSTARHHMNLLIYSLSPVDFGYTDTDSLLVTGRALKTIAEQTTLIDESSTAKMGTYKNDHEGAGDKIVFLSFLIAKKVKLHVTLDSFGKFDFHVTFKGFRPNNITDSGDHIDLDYIKFQKIRAISELFFDGKLQHPVAQSEWRRSIQDGIVIDREAAFEAKEETYYSHAQASLSIEFDDIGSEIELLIPHGPVFPLDYHLKHRHIRESHHEIYFWEVPPETESRPDRIHRAMNPTNYEIISLNLTPQEMRGRYESTYFKRAWRTLIDTIALTFEPDDNGIHRSLMNIDPEEVCNQEKWDQLFNQAPQLLPEDYVWPNSNIAPSNESNIEMSPLIL